MAGDHVWAERLVFPLIDAVDSLLLEIRVVTGGKIDQDE
jgi:hypothetical protein